MLNVKTIVIILKSIDNYAYWYKISHYFND